MIAGVAVVVSGCVAARCVPGPAATQPLTTQHTPHGQPTARTTRPAGIRPGGHVRVRGSQLPELRPPPRYGATGSRTEPRVSSASCSRNGSTAARQPSGWS
ncbi:hypothetical protein SMICM304S_12123 [Streptomyces microflavus]